MTPSVVAVAHRHLLVAEGLIAGLNAFPGLAALGAVTTATELRGMAGRLDAAAIDAYLPGAPATARVLRRHGVRVVFVGHEEEGADGVWVSPAGGIEALALALVPGLRAVRGAPSLLTPRERQILQLVARGMAGKQVARHLGISPKTVERHKAHIYAKLGVPNQAAAVSVAMAADGGRESWSLSIT